MPFLCTFWIRIDRFWNPLFMSCFLQSYIVALRCFNSVPLAPYFMRICTISKSSIFTISCKCIFGKTEIYVKYWSWFRINLFFGENVTMNVCICDWQCLNHPRTVWNVWISQKIVKFISNFDPNWTQLDHIWPQLDPSGP